MSKRTVEVKDRQSLVDIALQEHGSVEGLFTILADDATIANITQDIAPGQLLKVLTAPIDREVVSFFARSRQKPITGELLPAGFVCAGPGHSSAVVNTGATIYLETDTGFWTMTNASGDMHTFESGSDGFVAAEDGTWCVFPSNALGIYTGNVTFVYASGPLSFPMAPYGAALDSAELVLSGTAVDFAGNTGLTELILVFSGESVDLSDCTQLSELFIEFEGTELDLTPNTALEILRVAFSGTALNVSTMPDLEELYVSGPILALDVTENLALRKLSAQTIATTIDLSQNAALDYLLLAFQGTSLDLTNNPLLSFVSASYPGTGIDLSGLAQLNTLELSFGGTSINLTSNVALVDLDMTSNITSVDLSFNDALVMLRLVHSGLVTVLPSTSAQFRSVDIQGTALSQTSVDLICLQLDSSVGGSSSNLSGGTAASPSNSTPVQDAIEAYEAAGNTFTSN